jgi:hypothetical protein
MPGAGIVIAVAIAAVSAVASLVAALVADQRPEPAIYGDVIELPGGALAPARSAAGRAQKGQGPGTHKVMSLTHDDCAST